MGLAPQHIPKGHRCRWPVSRRTCVGPTADVGARRHVVARKYTDRCRRDPPSQIERPRQWAGGARDVWAFFVAADVQVARAWALVQTRAERKHGSAHGVVFVRKLCSFVARAAPQRHMCECVSSLPSRRSWSPRPSATISRVACS